MGRTAVFTDEDFLLAGIRLTARKGPSVTVEEIASELSAPVGSFYYRYNSRAEILGLVWMSLIETFQAGFAQALRKGGLEAALFTVRWSEKNPDSARILALYRASEFSASEWSESLRVRHRKAQRNLRLLLAHFSKEQERGARYSLARIRYAIIDAPLASVKPWLAERQRIPAEAARLVEATYKAVMK